MTIAKAQLIRGGHFDDNRGRVSFVNDFGFQGIRRFYCIQHGDTQTVRAWQGHQMEHKYFYVASGSFLIAWVAIDDWNNPSPYLKAESTVLRHDEPALLHIPAGYANGMKALEPGAQLLVYSDQDLEAARQDDWRFNADLWLDWTKY